MKRTKKRINRRAFRNNGYSFTNINETLRKAEKRKNTTTINEDKNKNDKRKEYYHVYKKLLSGTILKKFMGGGL